MIQVRFVVVGSVFGPPIAHKSSFCMDPVQKCEGLLFLLQLLTAPWTVRVKEPFTVSEIH